MRRTFVLGLAAVSLLAGLIVTPTIQVLGATPNPAPAAQAKSKMQAGERYGNMRAALQLLEQAEAKLRVAETKFGGHREKALQLTQEAIKEVHAGITYATERKEK